MAIAFDGESMWVANFGSSNLTRINVSDHSTFTVSAGINQPLDVVFDGEHIWVANGAGSVVKLNRNGLVRASRNFNTTPSQLVFDGKQIWAALNSGAPSAPNAVFLGRLRLSDASLIGFQQLQVDDASYLSSLAFDGAYVWSGALNGALNNH